MQEQRHLIKRQVIELQVQRQADAWPLQAEVSRIYRQRLLPIIEQCCTALSTPDRLYRIETLALDLGVVDPEHLEEELMARLTIKLPIALATQINAQEQNADRQAQSVQAMSHLELFTGFARTGSLPWWADMTQPTLLADTLRQLIQTTPDSLRRALVTIAGDPSALHRLALHYPDDLLLALAGLLLPSFHTSFTHELPGLLMLLEKSATVLKRRPAHLRQSFWVNLLTLAGLAEYTYPTPAAFYAALLLRVARTVTIPYTTLLAAIQARLTSDSDAQPNAFQPMFTTLYHDAAQREPSNAATGQPAAVLSVAEPALTTWVSRVRALTAQLPPSLQEQVAVLLRRAESDLSVRVLPAVLQQRLLALLQHAVIAETLAPEYRRTIEELLPRLQSDAIYREPAERTVPAPLVTSVTDVSEVEELYIGNAGVVLLWPFLGHFFARLGLLVEQQFKDETAQQRAVGLLQHLATGAEIFPEYLLPLNKLLCGMALTAVFDFGPPLTDTEATECLDLLRAVIEHAPILREMSPAGLQGTFLLRQGVLRTRDGAWLLQVEGETYDVVLAHFPWQWAWVKLPWMDAPLRVEW